jgi:tetratricopeptide (TPR) repeat protein
LTSRSATANSYIERGNAAAAKGEYERAIADYDLAITTDPDHAGAYYNRAVTRYRLNDYERALMDFTRAIQLNPSFTEAYVQRGGLRYALGDLDGAISDSNTAADGGSQSEAVTANRSRHSARNPSRVAWLLRLHVVTSAFALARCAVSRLVRPWPF